MRPVGLMWPAKSCLQEPKEPNSLVPSWRQLPPVGVKGVAAVPPVIPLFQTNSSSFSLTLWRPHLQTNRWNSPQTQPCVSNTCLRRFQVDIASHSALVRRTHQVPSSVWASPCLFCTRLTEHIFLLHLGGNHCSLLNLGGWATTLELRPRRKTHKQCKQTYWSL